MTILKKGDKSSTVAQVQAALKITADGVFGPATEAAVRQFQSSRGLAVDGIVGPATLKALGITTTTVRVGLTDQDYQQAAKLLSRPNKPCKIAAIMAVSEVETRGSPFLPDGRTVILYERHQFYKYLTQAVKPGQTLQQLIALRDQLSATQRDICYPSMKIRAAKDAKGNPVPLIDKYRGGTMEYEFLDRARQYSDTAALMSASYGRYQIMGFNYKTAGYESVQAMYNAMQQSERDHLDAFCGFIIGNPKIHNALLDLNWPTFATGYNGPAYGDYDQRMAKAFAKYS